MNEKCKNGMQNYKRMARSGCKIESNSQFKVGEHNLTQYKVSILNSTQT